MNTYLPFFYRGIRQRVRLLFLILLGLSATTQAQTTIRYVKPTASGNGDGSSWSNAANDLQAMVTASGSGQQVWVAVGSYQPAVSSSFALKAGVALYGGFAGTESSLSQRPAVNPLAGSPASSTLTGNGSTVIRNPASLSLTATAVLDGFVITGGTVGINSLGGGIYNDTGSPSITNCSFRTNRADYGGGGIYNVNSSPTLTNCLFQSNTAGYGGGGMYNEGNSRPALVNCLFQSNTATFGGGGLYNYNGSSPSLINCLFQGNTATNGGGMYNYNSSPALVNCSFQGNSGGTFANTFGGGIYNYSGKPSLTNCSFQGNLANTGGAMYNSVNSSPVLTNTVVFGNGGANTFRNDGSSLSASYSLFETLATGYTDGGNNLTTTISPFVSTSVTQLNGCAPAINTGSNTAYTTATASPSTDLAGNPRLFPINGVIDMGAYEYQANPTAISVNLPTVGTATVGSAFSQTFTAAGGTSPYSFSVGSSNLPASLSLSAAGILAGTPTQIGSYSLVIVTQDAGGCSGRSGTYTLTVNAVTSASLTVTGFAASPAAVCIGSPLTFTASVGSAASGYSWTLTNGGSPVSSSGSTTASTYSATVTASGTGVQTYTLTVTANGQLVTATTSLTVNALPAAGLTNNGPLTCSQSSVTLTASGGTGTPTGYTFTSADGTVLAGSGNTRAVTTAGTYSVRVTHASGCMSTTSTTVTSSSSALTATLSASPSATLTCAHTSLTLTAGGGTIGTPTGYVFSGPGVVSQSGNTAVVNASGVYSVTVSNTATGCTSSISSMVFSSTAVVTVTNPMLTTTLTNAAFSQSFTATGGTAPYSFSLMSGALPAGLSLTTTGLLSGTPTQATSFSLTVRATDANGCQGVSSSYSLTIGNAPVGSELRLIQPLYNCQSGAITFRTTGGDGISPIEFRAVGVTDWTTNPNQVVDIGVRQDGNSQPLLLQARQRGSTTTFTFDFRLFCNVTPGTGPLVLIQPLYNCQTGAITFRTSGGDGSLVYFNCPGVVSYSTQASYVVDIGIRQDVNSQPLLIRATQGGITTSYVFDFRLFCAGNQPGAAPVLGNGRLSAGDVQPWSVLVVGNPVQDAINVVISGAAGQSLELRLSDLSGHVVATRRVLPVSGTHREVLTADRQAGGLLLLQVIGDGRSRTVKVLKE